VQATATCNLILVDTVLMHLIFFVRVCVSVR